MTTVALIGCEGSGKTVLAAALARRFGAPDLPIFLSPDNPETFISTAQTLTALNDLA